MSDLIVIRTEDHNSDAGQRLGMDDTQNHNNIEPR